MAKVKESDPLMISFSGGRTSAYMTLKLIEKGLDRDMIVCFANTGKEEPETLDFVNQCDLLWGGMIHWLEYNWEAEWHFKEVSFETASRNGEPYEALIRKRGYLPNVLARFCTQDLKIRTIKRFMMSLGHEHWMAAIGIRHDEPRRWAKTEGVANRERWNVWMPLVDWKITKPMILDFWKGMPFDLQLEHYQGNCDLCFLKGLHKIKRLIKENPEKAEWWSEMERLTGGTFRKQISMDQITENVKISPTLFDYEDPDFECFCNID